MDKLAAVDGKRSSIQDMAAEGHISFEELGANSGSWRRPARRQ
jgi:hypothetical protein